MSKPDQKRDASLNLAAVEAQRALRERPSLSLRARLATSLVLWLIVSLGLIVTSIVVVKRIKEKLQFLETAEMYGFEIQQARRFEKNFFLYGTNLDDALEHVSQAKAILEHETDSLMGVLSPKAFAKMQEHLLQYEELLAQLRNLGARDAPTGTRGQEIESALRDHGAVMVATAEQLTATERRAVHSMLRFSEQAPIPFLITLILIVSYLAFFVSQQILAPIGRILQATRRIAAGDYRPIWPRRRYNDELSEVALAMNHMMHQLVERQDMLVRAHKLKAVGTLTAGIAHELNNPINNIMLTSSMLQEDYAELTDEERLEMAGDLVGESERAQKIIRNLLDFARERDVQAAPLEIGSLVEEVLRLAGNQIKLARVRSSFLNLANLPPVFGDRQQLQQVLLNLVINALDAMPDGGTLSLATRRTDDREHVAVDISDTGIGIPEHQLEDIFDPFFTTKAKSKGTGLGLSVSLNIVKKHGGDLRVRSEPNEGTTFTMLLPLVKIPAEIHTTEEDSIE